MADSSQEPQVFGHPAGLYTLFFAEMWERFSYYGMRALLVFYMMKGFLGYTDDQSYAIYGAYTALVYATPFIGGMLADKLLGARQAVIIGGTLMALGHLLMGVQNQTAFFVALGLLIVGNGFFKPNISTIVGRLYPPVSPKKDAGFTIFYMGINLGAAMSPLLCGYVGETYGWHYGFNLATIGMLIGLAVFAAPTLVTQLMILGGALGSGAALIYFQNSPITLAINAFIALALVTAAVVATVALQRGGLPDGAGAPPDRERLLRKVLAGLTAKNIVMVGILAAIPICAVLTQHNAVAGYLLAVFGIGAFGWLFIGALQSPKVERERLFVVFVLTFFSMMFWAFFEQAGSSVNNFTDRNVTRVSSTRTVVSSEIGQTIELDMNQGQLGYHNGDKLITMTALDDARKNKTTHGSWLVTADDVGMTVGGNEIPASTFQAANPIFIIVLGLGFTALWTFLGDRKLEPSTPVKFSLGLLQLGLGFVVLWLAADHADARGMVWAGWLVLAYLLHTTGELCLSPVGLSMVTKLAPARMVSTVMGAWFLSNAFSNFLAGIIARFTGVQGEGDNANFIPAPIATIHIYGGVFKVIAFTAMGAGVVCFLLAPVLKRWMHTEETAELGPPPAYT